MTDPHLDINRVSHIVETLTELEDWASSRETSIEIAYAIMRISLDAHEAHRTWAAATDDDYLKIESEAFKIANADEAALCFGVETVHRDN